MGRKTGSTFPSDALGPPNKKGEAEAASPFSGKPDFGLTL
jgi:hypothetical protein